MVYLSFFKHKILKYFCIWQNSQIHFLNHQIPFFLLLQVVSCSMLTDIFHVRLIYYLCLQQNVNRLLEEMNRKVQQMNLPSNFCLLKPFTLSIGLALLTGYEQIADSSSEGNVTCVCIYLSVYVHTHIYRNVKYTIVLLCLIRGIQI